MSGSMKRKLCGMLALAAALVLAGAGCTGAPEDLEDDEGDLSASQQGLDSIDSDDPTDDADDGAASAGQSSEPGGHAPTGVKKKLVPVSGPDPLPWNGLVPPADDDPEAAIAAPPMTHGSGGPSTGNGGK